MLKLTPEYLMEEVHSAVRHAEKHLRPMSDQVRSYHGPDYMEGQETEYNPENHAYEYISLVLPRIIYDNPRVRMTTRRPGSQSIVAEALRHGINRWCRDTRLRNLLVKVCVDMFFNYGVVLTTQSFMPGYSETEDPRAWPSTLRIPQRLFFRDPAAHTEEECRFLGHRMKRDKDDLLREARDNPKAGWNYSVLREWSASSNDGLETADRKNLLDVPDREQIELYELWIPEVRLPDSPGPSEGFNGAIFTLGVEQSPDRYGADGASDERRVRKAAFVREPRPYYGPRWGPYSVFGVYPVPDQPYALSPLAAVNSQVVDLNRHARHGSNNAAAYKRLVFVDNSDPALLNQIKSAEDLFVIPVNGLEKAKVVQVELAGITPEVITYIQMAKERLDRNSGLHDAQRGNVSGDGTATEVAVADNASTARMSFVRQQFAEGVTKVLKTVAWFLYHDDRVDFPLGEEAAEQMGAIEPWFMGGTHPEGSGATFDDLELEIEPYSMERASERSQVEKTMAVVQTVAAMAPVINQFPDLADWPGLFEKLGDAMNLPELDKLLNLEAATGQPPSGGEQPRLTRDAGATGAYGQYGGGQRSRGRNPNPIGHSEGARVREGAA